MTDVWLGRIFAVGQIALMAICGALIALGHNSVITDLFLAAGGSLIGSSVVGKLTKAIK